MKKKSFITLATGAFALAALAVTGILVLGNSNLSTLGIARANPTSSGSYTLTADDFSNGAGNITKGGDTWHFEKVTKDGSTVSVGGVFYTVTRSGSSKADQRRGDGYTGLVFSGLDISHSAGLVIYEKDLAEGIKNTIVNITSELDLTVGGTIASSSRRGLQFAQQEGDGKYFSFTSLTVHYACTDVVPEIEITDTDVQLGVDENFALHTERHDVFDGDTVSVAWSSDDDDIVSVTDAGVITGVAAGTTDITVTMTVNGKDYTDSIEVTVTAAQATVIEVEFKTNSYVEGAGIFANFDTTSLDKTAAQITAFPVQVSFDGLTQNMTSNTVRDVVGNTFQCYTVMDGAAGMSGQFSVNYDFKDNANNIIYRAAAHFDAGKAASPVVLSASGFSVDVADTLEVTASKGFYLEGTPSAFAFESLDTSKFTVTSNGAVATITGVAEGSASLRVTMTLGGVYYVVEKTISVTQPGVQHLITWYTAGTGNQRNWWQGAGVWTWVKYGDMGYADFAAFSAQKANMTVSCDKEATIRVDVISDDVAASKFCRVYLVAGSAQGTSTITMTIPDANGVTCTGSITFVDGEATAFNGVPINA